MQPEAEGALGCCLRCVCASGPSELPSPGLTMPSIAGEPMQGHARRSHRRCYRPNPTLGKRRGTWLGCTLKVGLVTTRATAAKIRPLCGQCAVIPSVAGSSAYDVAVYWLNLQGRQHRKERTGRDITFAVRVPACQGTAGCSFRLLLISA